ncbi:MerR family transcriptional regulator [Actinoallomurus sp. CA-150999]|uniref:MerR family transcriptional regulator n=1 Tax=Actinoallomurus sp. CA-150999 TaxID=3239887 RepID=UPI003D935548
MLEVKQQPESESDHSIPRTGLSIAEAARRTGVSVHTLRYYERAGLVVTPVERNHSGRRRYHRLDLQWITICTKLRATGMPIKTIRRYAQLVSDGSGNEQERLALLEAHRAEVTAKLAEIQENLRLIDHKIDTYRGSLAVGDADRLWAPTR